MPQFNVGDTVVIQQRVTAPRVGGDNYYSPNMKTVGENSTGEISRSNTNSSLVRFRQDVSGMAINAFSIWIRNDQLALDGTMPRKRKLGEKPEGDEYLDPRDPRLEWFWDDISEYANKSSYCSTFDDILSHLNLPGRKKQYVGSIKLDGLDISARVTARSQQEADQLVRDKIAASKLGTEEKAS